MNRHLSKEEVVKEIADIISKLPDVEVANIYNMLKGRLIIQYSGNDNYTFMDLGIKDKEY